MRWQTVSMSEREGSEIDFGAGDEYRSREDFIIYTLPYAPHGRGKDQLTGLIAV